MRRCARAVGAALVVAIAVGACGDDQVSPRDAGSAPASPGAAPHAPVASLDWEDCGDGQQCADLAVPLDHRVPDGETIDLALVRRPAGGQRVGSLLVNPGGPGGSGIDLVGAARDVLPAALLERFDVVGWDPRGVGRSGGARCLDDAAMDAFWAVDRSPDTAEEVRANVVAAELLAAGCEHAYGDRLAHLSSTATVHDVERIRVALGEDRLTYLGFSYGTYLGARYAEEYPERVRALVLDGAVDPSLAPEDANRAQAVGFERALRAFFVACSEQGCTYSAGDDPGRAYDRLVARIDRAPLPAGAGRVLGPGEADVAVAHALYGGRRAWPRLADALEAAVAGDGRALADLADRYTGRGPDGSYDSGTGAFYATGCLDGPALGGVDEVAEHASAVAAVAPRFGPPGAWLGLVCAMWRAPPDAEPTPIRAAGAPPLLVLGTAGDPVTPEEWAAGLADQLDAAVLVVLEDEGHTASGRGNRCIDALVTAYLVDLAVPAPTRCPAE